MASVQQGSDPSSSSSSSGSNGGNGRARVQSSAPGYVPGDDPHARLDVRVDTAAREGLAGTTPSNIYKPVADRETITIAPDWQPMDQQPAWRKDFPIDWPQDHYVARRDFTKFLVLTSLAFTVGQFWIGAQNWWRRRRGQPPITRIASADQLAPGQSLMFNYPGPHDASLLIRTKAGQLVAFSQKCTHLSCAVVPKPEDGIILCPCHEGYFDLETGRNIAGPPPRPLPRITLDVRGNDVYATGVEWRTV